MSEAKITGLAEAFRLQNGAVTHNWSAAQEQFALIERGIVHGWDFLLRLEEPDVSGKLLSRTPDYRPALFIAKNMLHSALAVLVNASRLALFGAKVDSIALARNSYEICFHVEYFRDLPDEAYVWDAIANDPNPESFRKRIDAVGRRAHKHVQIKWPLHNTRSFDRELSTHGTHTNPITVVDRTASDLSKYGNLGFVSAGRIDSPRHAAYRALDVLRYVLTELHEWFDSFLDPSEVLLYEFRKLDADIESMQKSAPVELVLFT